MVYLNEVVLNTFSPNHSVVFIIHDMVLMIYKKNIPPRLCGLGLGAFVRWWPTSAMWAGPLIYFWPPHFWDVWIIPSFRIWDYVLLVEHVSCVITNCGQHQWVIPSPLSIALQALLGENTTRKLLSLSLDFIFKILLFQVTFLIFFSIAIFSHYFLQVGLLLQCMALFQSGM